MESGLAVDDGTTIAACAPKIFGDGWKPWSERPVATDLLCQGGTDRGGMDHANDLDGEDLAMDGPARS